MREASGFIFVHICWFPFPPEFLFLYFIKEMHYSLPVKVKGDFFSQNVSNHWRLIYILGNFIVKRSFWKYLSLFFIWHHIASGHVTPVIICSDAIHKCNKKANNINNSTHRYFWCGLIDESELRLLAIQQHRDGFFAKLVICWQKQRKVLRKFPLTISRRDGGGGGIGRRSNLPTGQDCAPTYMQGWIIPEQIASDACPLDFECAPGKFCLLVGVWVGFVRPRRASRLCVCAALQREPAFRCPRQKALLRPSANCYFTRLAPCVLEAATFLLFHLRLVFCFSFSAQYFHFFFANIHL